MDVELINKEVLLVCPSFYGYEKEIKNKLIQLGANVTFVNADPSEGYAMIMGAYKRIFNNNDIMIRLFEKKCFSRIPNLKFDFVIVICGWALTSRIISRIRKQRLNEGGRMVLYYWDSLTRLNDDIKRWDFFDSIYTFDSHDYETHMNRIKFLPLFYCDKYWQEKNDTFNCDLLSVGSFRLDRLEYMRHLIKANPSIIIKHYLYTTKWLIVFHKIFRSKYRGVSYSELQYKRLSFQEVIDMYSHSKAVLDVSANGQDGLTIRTFETFAMHKKLITTNDNIRRYEFYNADDIYVIESGQYKLPKADWFNKPFAILDETIKQYSINAWLKQLLGYE